MTTKSDSIGAAEAHPPDHIDLGPDSGLERYVPDTFADDAAAGNNAALARHFARRRDSSPCRARRGHDDGARGSSADDRPLLNDATRSVRRHRSNTDAVNRPRELGYQKPALPLAFAVIILVISFAVFFLLTADHFAPKHDGRGHQNTSTTTQNR